MDFTGKDRSAGVQPLWLGEDPFRNHENVPLAIRRQVTLTKADLRARVTASALPSGWVRERQIRMIGECVYIDPDSGAGMAVEMGRGEVVRVAIVTAIVAGYVTERKLVERIALSALGIDKNSNHLAKKIPTEVDKWPLGRELTGKLREDIEASVILIYHGFLNRISRQPFFFFGWAGGNVFSISPHTQLC